jgi:hypothetical protein
MTSGEGTVRLPLRWARVWAPLGWLIVGTPSRCWVEVSESEVAASFGPLGSARFSRSRVVTAQPVRWPWWRGFGVRWYGGGAVGFVGGGRGGVELALDPPVELLAVVNRRARRLALSPSDPERLLALLGFRQAPSSESEG